MINSNVVFLSGSMFGKKSKKLIDIINIAVEQKSKFLVYKPVNDTRDGLFVKSREYTQTVKALPWDTNDKNKLSNLKDNIKLIKNTTRPKIIFFDEVHFLPVEDIKSIYKICKIYKIVLVVSGLETDFKQLKFPTAEFLEKIADHHIFFHGVCKICRDESAVYNLLYDNNGNIVTEGNSIQPGDEEYNVLCEECFQQYP